MPDGSIVSTKTMAQQPQEIIDVPGKFGDTPATQDNRLLSFFKFV